MPLTTSLNLSLAVIDLSVTADVCLTPFQTHQLAVCLPTSRGMRDLSNLKKSDTSLFWNFGWCERSHTRFQEGQWVLYLIFSADIWKTSEVCSGCAARSVLKPMWAAFAGNIFWHKGCSRYISWAYSTFEKSTLILMYFAMPSKINYENILWVNSKLNGIDCIVMVLISIKSVILNMKLPLNT